MIRDLYRFRIIFLLVKFNTTSNSGQALFLAIANFISFSFGILSAAILSRFLSVQEYGSYRQVLYVYSTLLIVFTLGLPRAYSFFLARLPIEEGRSSVNQINSLFLLLGGLFSLVLFFGSGIIGKFLNNPSLTILLKWFAPTPLFLLPVMGIESVMATYKKSSYATLYVILSRTFTLACVVLPVIIIGPSALVAVIGFSGSSILCYIAGMYIERLPFRNVVHHKSSLKWKELLVYSGPLLMSSIWGVIYQSCPQFFISRWWGSVTFAEFSNGFIELPFASMIIGAVSTILLPAFSRCYTPSSKEGASELIRIWRSSFEKSAYLIYPLAIYAYIFATPIMELLYGSKYIPSAIFFQIILIINLTRVIPFGPIMMAMNRVRRYSTIMMIGAIFTVIGEFTYVNLYDKAWGIAMIQSIGFLLMIVLLFQDISKSLSVHIAELIPIRNIISLLLSSCVSVGAAFLITKYISLGNPIWEVFTGLSLSILFFIPMSRLLQLDYFSIIRDLIRK